MERTRLIITINGKTAEQMAEEYGFDREQKGYVAELLSKAIMAHFYTALDGSALSRPEAPDTRMSGAFP